MSGSRNRVLGYAPVTGALAIVLAVVLVTNGGGGSDHRLSEGGADPARAAEAERGGLPPVGPPPYEDFGVDYMPYSIFFLLYIHLPDHPVEMIGKMIASYHAGTRDISDRAADTFASDMYNILRVDRRSLHADYDRHEAEYLRAARLLTDSWGSGNITSAQLLESMREIPVGHRVDAFGRALWADADNDAEYPRHDGDHRWRHMAYDAFSEYPYGGTELYEAALHGINITRHEFTEENFREMLSICTSELLIYGHYNLETTYSPGSCILREPEPWDPELSYVQPCNSALDWGLPDHGLFCQDQVVCSHIASGYDADALVADLERHRQCHAYGFDIDHDRDKIMCDKLPSLFGGFFSGNPYDDDHIEYVRQKFC